MEPKKIRADVVILGCGVAGLTAAYELRRDGYSVTMIDQAAHCGGTHMSRNIGPYTFDAGSIFFEVCHPLFSMFEGVKERCPKVRRRQGRIAPDGRVWHYPFAMHEFSKWPLRQQARGIADLLRARLYPPKQSNAEDFCLSHLGKTTYERSGLKNYITRFHQTPARDIDVLFCERRMGFIRRMARVSGLFDMLRRTWIKSKAPPPPRPPMLVRPPEGFGALYEEIKQILEKRGVRFVMTAPLAEIRKEMNFFRVKAGAYEVEAQHVVGAMPLETMTRAALGKETGLESIDLLTLFISVSQIHKFDGTVLFNFHELGRWKRLTVYSRIYGHAEGREYFAVEITHQKNEPKNADAAFAQFCEDVRDFGLFSEDLALEGHEIIEDAYPLYRSGCSVRVEDAVAQLTEFGIIPVGRQGRFAYLPISAQVVERTRATLQASALGRSARVRTGPPDV